MIDKSTKKTLLTDTAHKLLFVSVTQ